jgi:uncharacterized protein YqgV (UPF0045/DUF77 family)
MVISVQVAIYPLRQQHLSPAIATLTDAFTDHSLSVEPGSMSTTVLGDAGNIFAALHDGFVRAAESGHVVMTVTVSNACPIEG